MIRLVVTTSNKKIRRRCLADYFKKLQQKACRTCLYGATRGHEFLISKEPAVLRRWERSKQKFGFIKQVDKG